MIVAISREKARGQLDGRPAGDKTICDVHRALWRDLANLPDGVRQEAEEKLITAYIMAKRMADHLLLRHKEKREGY